MSIEWKLKKPIRHGEEEISEITLREPTFEEIEAIGFPFRVGDENRAIPNAPLCAKYISKLSALPPSVVRQMHPSDFFELSYGVITFFVR